MYWSCWTRPKGAFSPSLRRLQCCCTCSPLFFPKWIPNISASASSGLLLLYFYQTFPAFIELGGGGCRNVVLIRRCPAMFSCKPTCLHTLHSSFRPDKQNKPSSFKSTFRLFLVEGQKPNTSISELVMPRDIHCYRSVQTRHPSESSSSWAQKTTTSSTSRMTSSLSWTSSPSEMAAPPNGRRLPGQEAV